jgi:hypothetical protein
MAFVVPAEIGHAPYARPLVSYLAARFKKILLLAVRQKIFPELSEDVWLLYAEGFGDHTQSIHFARTERFSATSSPPAAEEVISLAEWERWNFRMRPLLLRNNVRKLYQRIRDSGKAIPLGKIARVGIGYVTGANDFFHLRPSQAKLHGIPGRFLMPTVRNGRCLAGKGLRSSKVEVWLQQDQPVLLLRLPKNEALEPNVQNYLDSEAGLEARNAFKCRNRRPWYVVPDVRVPDAFLSYMSGVGPQLVANHAGCVCTNSVHAVHLKDTWQLSKLETMWDHALVRLSCEVEGHPLGGGMLKVEPGECTRILVPRESTFFSRRDLDLLEDGFATMRKWRHYE